MFHKKKLIRRSKIFLVNFSKNSKKVGLFEIGTKGDSKQYLRLRTMLWSPNIFIMPRIAEINGGIDICGECSKTRLKTLFSVSYFFAKLDQNFVSGRKICRCQPAVLL